MLGQNPRTCFLNTLRQKGNEIMLLKVFRSTRPNSKHAITSKEGRRLRLKALAGNSNFLYVQYLGLLAGSYASAPQLLCFV